MVDSAPPCKNKFFPILSCPSSADKRQGCETHAQSQPCREHPSIPATFGHSRLLRYSAHSSLPWHLSMKWPQKHHRHRRPLTERVPTPPLRSPSLMSPSWVRSTLPAFRSRWMIFLLWR